MIGVIANVAAIIVGATIGLLAKKIIPESWSDLILKGLGLCSIYIGISSSLDGENTLVLIMSIVVGAMIGAALKIEERFNGFAQRMENKMNGNGKGGGFAQGFITASLMMCVGAMSIMGPLSAGLKGDYSLLFTKTAIDFAGAIMFTASLGFGVLFAAIPVFILEGGLVLLASLVSPVLTADVVNEMICAGSLLIVAMGLNLTVGSKLKILNYMPAVFMPIALCPLYDLIVGMF